MQVNMAQIQLNIPNDEMPRIKEAFKAMLQEGDAVDINNPTDQEILILYKSFLKNVTLKRVLDYEKTLYYSQFEVDNINIT